MGTKCNVCNGVVEATPVDTSQFPSGSLQPVENACVCAPTCSVTSPTAAAKPLCPTRSCVPQCPPVKCVSPCEEDHTQKIIINQLSATVKTTDAFNFPAQGGTAVVKLAEVTSLIPGQILWNQGVGRLHVVSYDELTRKVTLTNLGDSCTATPASPGELIPSCTEFAVGIPECDGESTIITSGPFLAADMTGPANGSCTTIKVTAITGLSIGDVVSIASFQYRIDSIIDTETIVVCNDGDGAPTGQVIEWDPNGDEVPDVPIIPISGDNPCSKDPVVCGVLLVCDNGEQKPLEGSATGQVPIWDEEQQKFVLTNVNLEDNCTFLTACFSVDIGDDGPYLVTVADTSSFSVGQQVRVDGDLFTIDSIEDATHFRLIPDTTPGAIKEYAVGEQVCLRDCCEFLPQEVDGLWRLQNDGIEALSINELRTEFNIESQMSGGRYFTNSNNDIPLFNYTNNESYRQYIELHIQVLQAMTLNGGDKCLSEVLISNTVPGFDQSSVLPRAVAFFDSNNVPAGTPPAGFFNQVTGFDSLNAITQQMWREEFVDPGETVNYAARHFIAFDAGPITNGTNYYLFLHGKAKVFKAPV